jgi:hypothetical protein
MTIAESFIGRPDAFFRPFAQERVKILIRAHGRSLKRPFLILGLGILVIRDRASSYPFCWLFRALQVASPYGP